jgi:general stress protein CsbA
MYPFDYLTIPIVRFIALSVTTCRWVGLVADLFVVSVGVKASIRQEVEKRVLIIRVINFNMSHGTIVVCRNRSKRPYQLTRLN